MTSAVCLLAATLSAGGLDALDVDLQAVVEVLPLAAEAIEIQIRATEREARHQEELRRRGLVELPPCNADRYVMDVGSFGKFVFDDWGELSIDRRFVTDEEMQTVHEVEKWFQKWFGKAKHVNPVRPRPVKSVPVFRGFEDAHYQRHDALIARLVAEFNANKQAWCGGTASQAQRIEDLAPAMVKSQMIEESGGRDAKSRAAWAVDPLQVNVPGDWGAEKALVGLVKPEKRNEGTLEQNIRAGIMYLTRKGFGASGRPAADRPEGCFDGWLEAYRRYNGRRSITVTDRYYSHEYAEKILKRAAKPDEFVPIEIFLAE